MDSVTQFVLGAAVGEAVLGKKIGRRAMLWGGICGTIPDLDVLIPMGNAVADFTYHRSFSHSLFVLAVLTPLVSWLAMKIHKQPADMRHRWWSMVYLVFATHVLLDSFTSYGTQIFWPLTNLPVAWSSIFIIDPLYTVPIIIGLLATLVLKRQPNRSSRANLFALAFSSVYLCWSVVAKVHAEAQMRDGLAQQGVEVEALFTTPAPFTTLLWRGVAMTSDGYYEVYYSLFDDTPPTNSVFFASDKRILEPVQNLWTVERLQWFSKGFFNVREEDQRVIISDLRMGIEPTYVFQFAVAKQNGDSLVEIPVEQLDPDRDLSLLNKVWARIWSQDVVVSPKTLP